MRGHLVVDRLRERAAVERVRPLARDQRETPGEIRVCDALAGLERRRPVDRAAVPEVGARALGERAELLDVARGRERLVPVRHEALARERDRRGEDVGELHGAVALERQREPGDRPGHRDRPVAVLVRRALDARPGEEPVGDAADQPKHPLVGARRRDAVEVQRDRLAALLEVDEHRARACDRGHEGLDHRHRERGRDGGVHGVAPALEDRRAHRGAEWVLGRDEAAGRERRLLGHGQPRLDHRRGSVRARTGVRAPGTA